jgi:hypothetical protein
MARSALEMNTARAASRRERKKKQASGKTNQRLKSKNSARLAQSWGELCMFPIRPQEGD